MQTQIARRVQILLSLLILVASTYLLGVTWLFLSQFLSTFILFFLAWLLAYLLKPIVLRITRIGLPFKVAVLFVYIIGPALALLVAYLLIPAITQQTAQISNHLDEYTSKVSGLVDWAKGALISIGVSPSDILHVESKLRDAAGSAGQFVLSGGLGAVGGVANELFRISLVLVFSISFLVDGGDLASKALAAIPERWREDPLRLHPQYPIALSSPLTGFADATSFVAGRIAQTRLQFRKTASLGRRFEPLDLWRASIRRVP